MVVPLNPLSLIWHISLILAAYSLLVMTLLIIKRMITDKRARHRALRKTALSQQLLLYSERRLMPATPLQGMDLAIASELALELMRVISGEDKQALLMLLKELGVMEYQKTMLQKGSRKEKQQALLLLPAFDDPTIISLVADCLHHLSLSIRQSAIMALAESKAVDALPLMLERLSTDTPLSTPRLMDVFQTIGEEALPLLMSLIKDPDCQSHIKIAVLAALGSSGTFEAVPLLLRFCNDANPEVRAQSFSALAMLSDPRAEVVLKQGLTDPAWQVRLQAILCAGRLGAVSVMNELHHLLSDSEWLVRFHAADTLLQLGDKGLTLLKMIAQQPSEAGTTAQLLLAEKGYL